MKALIAALLISAAPATALDLSAMTEDERADFGAAVRAYLMENPQVLMEAIAVLEQQQAQDAAVADRALVAEHREALFDDPGSWTGGNPEGDITVVEFIDYRCGYCQRFNAEIQDTVARDGNVRFVLKELPVLGEDSILAARFAVSVLQQAGDDAYLAAHNALMEMRGPVNPDSLGRIARQAGADPEAVLAHMDSDAVTAVLAANQELAARMGIRGTPGFVIGDEVMRGMPQSGLEPVIAAVRERS